MISSKIKESLKNSSAIRKMFEEGIRLSKLYGAENVFDFSLGNPDMPPPKALIDGLKEFAGQVGIHRYMPNAGFLDVREKVAEKVAENSEIVKKINSNIQEQYLVIEYLEKVEKIMGSIGFDIRNIIEIQKLETQWLK